MITCTPMPHAGVMELIGITPSGTGMIVREQPGQAPFILRGGDAPITTGGFDLVDTEAPFGVPLTYRATVSNISSAERLVQQNLMLTPTFINGVKNWVTVAGRTLTTPADATAHSTAAVAQVSQHSTPPTPSAPPTLIGHKDTAVTVSGSYTLDPATPSGGGAVATNDWMLIIHTQLALSANPADPAGWTRIDDVLANNHRQIIWKRKRLAGDTSYTVAASSGSQSLGSLLWVRGSGDFLTLSPTATPTNVNFDRSITTNWHAVVRPALVVSIFSASATIGQRAALTAKASIRAEGGISSPTRNTVRGALANITAGGSGAGPVSGAAMNYMVNSVTLSPRTLIVGTTPLVGGGDSPPTSATYGSAMAMGFATQVVFETGDDLSAGIILKGKASAIPATTADAPHLLTGRYRFLHPGLWIWNDVKNQGTWQNLKNTKTTWLDVRGSSSTVSGNFLRLYVRIVDPATGVDYVPPQQVSVGQDIKVNTWTDFSMLFANTVLIPSTAEVWLVHGSATKEFGIQWYFDELGITPGAQRAEHPTVYWFSGDTPVSTVHPEDLAFPGGQWDPVTNDSSITWAGTVGNSVSELRHATTITATTTCQMDAPTSGLPCEPILLSDPTNVNLLLWAQLIGIGSLTHPANETISRVLKRKMAVAISQTRNGEEGDLQVQTNTLEERERMIRGVGTGRALLVRIPDARYPEAGWYVAIGDIEEARIFPDHRRPERLWTLPIVRVDRPTGLIEASGAVSWAEVLAMGNWAQVMAGRDNWLEVLVGGDV